VEWRVSGREAGDRRTQEARDAKGEVGDEVGRYEREEAEEAEEGEWEEEVDMREAMQSMSLNGSVFFRLVRLRASCLVRVRACLMPAFVPALRACLRMDSPRTSRHLGVDALQGDR
jgi:hypothetical protein